MIDYHSLSRLLLQHLQGAQASLGRGNNASNMQINVTVAKYKQQISNLQSQINAQQAVYVKQQQPQQQSQQQPHPAATHVTGANVEYLRGQHDAISALQGNFSEMNLNKVSKIRFLFLYKFYFNFFQKYTSLEDIKVLLTNSPD